MATQAVAPGAPGIAARWTSSAKSGVGTALSPACRIWFTISHGILNEVYYPRVDHACTRDLGLIVCGPDGYFSEEKRDARSADDRALMILSAQSARRHWERAGTWLEVERAEYRLAMTWLQAGDVAQARQHAQACLDIVAANEGAALERFFGWEALGVVERAAGNASAHAAALERVRAEFDELSSDDQSWCKESLDKLTSQAPG